MPRGWRSGFDAHGRWSLFWRNIVWASIVGGELVVYGPGNSCPAEAMARWVADRPKETNNV